MPSGDAAVTANVVVVTSFSPICRPTLAMVALEPIAVATADTRRGPLSAIVATWLPAVNAQRAGAVVQHPSAG